MKMMRAPGRLVIGFAVAALTRSFGQTAPGPPAFEVASIKLADPSHPLKGMYGYLTYPGGRVLFGGSTLEMLIEDALDLQPFQISGEPGWARSERYDIEAKAPASSESSRVRPPSIKGPLSAEQSEMLIRLLADRFQLKFHRETKEGPVYLLEKGKRPLKLENAKNKDDYPWVGGQEGGSMTGNGMKGTNISMSLLAERLMLHLGRPVLDQTGIEGSFDFHYDYVSGDAHPDIVSSIIASLGELGLELKAGKGPVEMIVIDHAEKPSPN